MRLFEFVQYISIIPDKQLKMSRQLICILNCVSLIYMLMLFFALSYYTVYYDIVCSMSVYTPFICRVWLVFKVCRLLAEEWLLV